MNQSFHIIRTTLLCCTLAIFNRGDLSAQEVKGVKQPIFSAQAGEQFRAYEVFQMDAGLLKQEASTQRVMLQIGDKVLDLALQPSRLIADNYTLNIQSEQGVQALPKTTVQAFYGFDLASGGQVRLTLDSNFIYGFFENGADRLYIEPFRYFDSSAANDLFIVYKQTDVLNDSGMHTCAASEAVEKTEELKGACNTPESAACYLISLAIASDRSMYIKYGSSFSAVENHNIAVLNNVAADFTNVFNQNIQFEIVTQFVVTGASDPWTTSTDPLTLLQSFAAWGEGGSFGVGYDIAQLWTNRNFQTNHYGISYLNGICNSQKYHCLQDFSTNAPLLRCLVSHMTGHNLGASHDVCPTNFIMCQDINGTSSWSSTSISAINSKLSQLIGNGCITGCSGPSLVADFYWPILLNCAGNPVQIEDLSSGDISSRSWTFEGGTPATSTDVNPVVVWNTAGTFDVTLTLQGNGGPVSLTRQIEIQPAVSISNIISTGLSGSFTVNGGIPQSFGGNYSTVTMTLQGNPGVAGTLTTAPFTHGETVNFVCPQAGVYEVVVVDGSGCSSSASVTVTNNSGGYNGPGLPAGDCWTWQNPLPQGNTLNDVFFVDEQTGWAVGNSGTVIKTVNGGISWTLQASETNTILESVHFTNAQTGWAVGWNGTILKTINGGITWTTQTSGINKQLFSIDFIDSQTGWIVGDDGTILKTVNGGDTWTAQASGTTLWLESVHFIDAQTGWAVGGNGIILKTINGGSTWAAQASATNNTLLSVHFTNAQVGFAVGREGTILKSVNGGLFWFEQNSGTTNWLYKVSLTDAQTGWAVGWNGTILKTVNGGNNWSAQNSGTGNDLYSIKLENTQTGWAVGSSGTMLKTVNGGSNWTTQSSGTNDWLESVEFVDAQTGWTVGWNGAILKTVNGGSNWSAQNSGTTSSLHSVHFANVQTGWVVGQNGTILKTVNSGNNWTPQNSGTGNWLECAYFTGTQTGWAVGQNGTILKTVNGGNNWTIQTSGTSNLLKGVYFVDAQTGWAIGQNGTILKTINGGNSWTVQNSGTTNNLLSVWFKDTQTGWIGREWETMLQTVDGGNTWTANTSGITSSLHGIFFTDPQTGWAVGASTILKTVDSGNTWTEQYSGTLNSLFGVHFADTQTGWTVGLYGTILKYTPAIPNCIPAIPIHNQTDVPTTTPITWPEAVGCEDGYRLQLSTTPGGADLLDTTILGIVTSFQPANPLPAGTTIYVRISPFNDLGAATGCTEFFFITSSACPPTAQFFVEDRCITGPNTYTLRFSASCTGYTNISSVVSNVGTPDVLPPPIDEGEITGIPFNVPVNVTVELDAFYQLEAVTCPYTHMFSAFSGTQQSVSSDNGNTVCSGTTLSVPNVPGATFQWRLNGVSIGGANSATYLATTPGTYDVTWTEPGSCTNYSSTITLVSPPLVCNNINVPCNAPETSPDYLLNQLNINNAFPDAYPCPGFNLTYSDQEIPQPCNSGLTQIIERSWTAADGLGNSVSCLQVINQPAPELSDVVMPPDYDPSDVPAYACSENADFSPAWLESQGLQGFPQVFGFSGGCNITWEFSDDLVDLMNGGFVINRTWTATDFCSGTTAQHTQSIQYSIPPLPVLEVTEGCIGGTLTLAETSGTAGQWSWSGPGGFTASGNPATRNNLVSGHAGIYGVTVTNGQGCTAESSVNVNVGNQLNVSVTGSGPACAESNITLTASSGSSWVWQGPDNFSANVQNPSINNLSNLQAGLYSVTVSDGSGCTGVGTYQLAVTDFDVAVTSTEVNCLFNLACTPSGNAGGPLRYDWADLPGTDDPANRSNLPSGAYSLTVTDQASGCTITFSTSLTAAALQLSPVVTPATSCTAPNGAIQLNIQGAIGTPQFSWNTGATSQNLQNIPPGVYAVTVTNGNGCTTTAQATVSGPTSFTASAVPTATSSCTVANGSISVSLNGSPVAPTGFLWNTGATTQNLQNLPQGTYSVTVTDAAGCTATAQATVSGPTSFTAGAVPTASSSCSAANGSISVSLNGSPVAPTGFLWNTGATSQNLQNLPPGTYSVTVTDAAGCTATAQATVSGPMTFTASATFSPATSCTVPNGSVTLELAGAAAAPTSYLWNTGATSQNLQNLPPGTYSVTVTDAVGCTATAQATVTGPAPLIFNIGVTMSTSCTVANGALNLNVQSGAPPYSYLWNTGATSEDLNNIPSGDYTVTVTDGNLCTATQTGTVENNSAATLSSSQSQSICPGDSVALGNVFYKMPGLYQQTLVSWLGCDSVATLNLSFTDPGSFVAENDSFFVFNTLDESLLDVLFNDVLGNNDYLLGILNQPQNGEASVKNNEALKYVIGQADFAGIEVIRYTICSSVCTSVCDTAVALVIVTEDVSETFKKNSSNVLTPVIQDGINDLFDPIFVMEKLGYPINEANSSLDIFNRWGDLVVSKQRVDVRWNGMTNSQPVPQGTYYYIFRADIGQAKPVVVVGALMVLER